MAAWSWDCRSISMAAKDRRRWSRGFRPWLGETTDTAGDFDERFSTVEAESALWQAGLTHKKRKARRDRVAAQILLQAYLDAGCPADPQAGPLDE